MWESLRPKSRKLTLENQNVDWLCELTEVLEGSPPRSSLLCDIHINRRIQFRTGHSHLIRRQPSFLNWISKRLNSAFAFAPAPESAPGSKHRSKSWNGNSEAWTYEKLCLYLPLSRDSRRFLSYRLMGYTSLPKSVAPPQPDHNGRTALGGQFRWVPIESYAFFLQPPFVWSRGANH